MGALICKKRTPTTTKRKRRRRRRRRRSCAEREREQATRTLSQGPSVGRPAPRTLLQGRLWGLPPSPNPLRMGHLWDLWVPYYTRYNPQELRLYNIIYDS
jgi:hypothetical protein